MLVNYNSKINCFDDQVPSFYKNIAKFSKLKDCLKTLSVTLNLILEYRIRQTKNTLKILTF